MKNLMNLGKALNKAEQKIILGGNGPNRLTRIDHQGDCTSNGDCPYIIPFSAGTIGYGTCGGDGYCYY